MKRYWTACMVVACGFAACAPTPREIILQHSYNPADFAWAEADGTNTVRGSALLRTVGGEVRTCGGLSVQMIPDVPYSRERIMHLYGKLGSGFQPASAAQAGGIIFMGESHEYTQVGRRTVCDAQGNFRFENVPDGDWFVVAEVVWGVPYSGYVSPQGGRLMQQVTVADGETRELILTHQ